MVSSKSKMEPINLKLDFSPDLGALNQVLNYERVQTYISYAKSHGIEESRRTESPNINTRFSSHRVSENPFVVATDEEEDYAPIKQKSPKNKKRADSEKGWHRGSSSGFKAAGPASGESPPTFLKGISS